MPPYFLVAFIVCLFGYIFHTVSHFLEHKGRKSEMLEIIAAVIIFIGYIAWGLMIALDPIKINIPPDYIAIPMGLLIGLTGLLIFVLSTRTKKGFYELDYLVTKGIYSKIRNPMYLGIILIHIGFPIVSKSLLTLISAIIWIPIILIWKYWEEKDLLKKFGNEYAEYKKQTWF